MWLVYNFRRKLFLKKTKTGGYMAANKREYVALEKATLFPFKASAASNARKGDIVIGAHVDVFVNMTQIWR